MCDSFSEGVSRGAIFPYHKFGDVVTLKCAHVIDYPDCSSTTWLFNRNGTTINEVKLGKKIENPARGGRLHLGSDCSLTVYDVRAEDAGVYICQQYDSHGSQYGEDTLIYLSLLTITPSSSAAILKSSTDLVLSCSLFTYEGCEPKHTMKWFKEHSELQEEQITRPLCESTLTVRKEDNNTRFRCQLNKDKEAKTFVDFTPVFPGNTPKTATRTTTAATWFSDQIDIFIAVGGALGAALVISFIILIIIGRRKRNTKTQSFSPTPTDDQIGLNAISVNMSQTDGPTSEDKTDPDDGLTYVFIDHSKKKTTPGGNAQKEDNLVTYATVK